MSRTLRRVAALVAHVTGRPEPGARHDGACAAWGAVCMGFAGDVHGLTLDSVQARADEFERSHALRRSLLAVPLDVANMAAWLRAHGVACESDARVVAGEVQQLVARAAHRAECTALYFSGHGRVRGLCAARASRGVAEEVVAWRSVVDAALRSGARDVLLIAECCHSGAAAAAVGQWTRERRVAVLAACAPDEESGSWVLDGADSGGILTKALVAPIDTWFKVRFHVFCALPAAHVHELHAVLLRVVSRMLRVGLPREQWAWWSAEPWRQQLVCHFAFFQHLAAALPMPQRPRAFPPLPAAPPAAWHALEDRLAAHAMRHMRAA